MPSPDQILTAYQDRVAKVREQTTRVGVAIWNGLPDYRDKNIDDFVAQIVPRVRAGQMKTAQLTAAFIRQSAKAQGDDVPMALVDRAGIAAARAVDPQVEYRRPAVAMRTALSNDASFTDSVKQGAARLLVLMETDLQLAKTTQAQASLKAGGYTYYRRVLTGAENCALCAIASTQRYHVRDLMPIHGHCDCTVEAVPAGRDPGQVIDPSLLAAVHAHIEATGGSVDPSASTLDYRKLIVTHENSEYGLVLAWKSDHFTTIDQIAA